MLLKAVEKSVHAGCNLLGAVELNEPRGPSLGSRADDLDTPVHVAFNIVERLVKQGRMDKDIARRLIDLELRSKALSNPEREYLLALRRVVLKSPAL